MSEELIRAIDVCSVTNCDPAKVIDHAEKVRVRREANHLNELLSSRSMTSSLSWHTRETNREHAFRNAERDTAFSEMAGHFWIGSVKSPSIPG